MPGRDRTGPEGRGSRTGRGMGDCGPDEGVPGRGGISWGWPFGFGRGRGSGQGRGRGQGGGRGFGWRWWRRE